MIDLTKYDLNEKQVELLRSLSIPIFHHFNTDTYHVASRYWYSIKPLLQKTLVSIVLEHATTGSDV